MPLEIPSLQPITGILPSRSIPVEMVYGPYTGANIDAAKQAALEATVGRRYVSMKVGLIVNGVGYVYYFKNLDTLEPIGGGATGPQGNTGPQGATGPDGAAASSSIVIEYDFPGQNKTFPRSFGTKPLVTVLN